MKAVFQSVMLFLFLYGIVFGQEQVQGFFKFLGFFNEPQISSIINKIHNKSRRECSSKCLKDENCYFFDICKTGSSISCYFYNNNLVNTPGVQNGMCRRYELVFQRRVDGTTDFYRGWTEYENGFGDLANNFYMGNYYLHEIVKSGDYELRVELEDQAGERAYAGYTNFMIGGPSTFYTLEVSGFFGNGGDSLGYHNGMKFTTYDRDNDEKSYNCAGSFNGAWWYKSCHYSGLNGQYGIDTSRGIIWYHWRGYQHSLVRAQMMVRRKIKHQY